MGSRTNIERLEQIPPSSGRVIGENGVIYNSADALGFNDSVLITTGRLFFARYSAEVSSGDSTNMVVGVPDGEDFEGYSIGIYRRALNASGGTWEISTVENPDVSGGDSLTGYNLKRDEPDYEGSVLQDATLDGGNELPGLKIYSDGPPRGVGTAVDASKAFLIAKPGERVANVFKNESNDTRDVSIEVDFFLIPPYPVNGGDL